MRTNIALYPFCVELLPVVRHFDLLQEQYHLACVLAPKGYALGGKDAGFAANHPDTGYVVQDLFDEFSDTWECLL